MKIALVHLPPGLGRSFIHATANVPRYLTHASAYKTTTRFFTRYVKDPLPDLDIDLPPPHLSERQALEHIVAQLRALPARPH